MDGCKEGYRESRERYGFGTQAMKKVKVCEVCGAVSLAAENFCRECGTKLPRRTLYQTYKKRSRYCSFCDTVVATKTQFCPSCGKRLKRQIKGGKMYGIF